MATLEEVSVRLMQPAKDLADGNYQLAKDLEKFCTAVQVEEAEDINYTKAGLVVQNSVNVYVRRVEYLYQNTTSMGQSLTEHEAAEESAKSSKKENRSKKIVVDFGDFEPIDFGQFVSKNHTIKARNGVNNSVNLLSQRFPQLENVSRSKLPIEIYDVHGELVGKKYDFRCNQYLTASGMLVEHLGPEDFQEDFLTNEDANDRSQSTETRAASNTISERCEFDNEDNTEIRETFEGAENCNFASETQDKDTDVLDSSFTSYADSGIGTSIRSPDITTRPESSLSCDREMPWTSPGSRAGSSLSDVEKDNTPVDKDSLQLDNSQNASTTNETNVNTETGDELSQCNNSPVNVDESENCVVNVEKNNNESSNDNENNNPQARRSKRIKNAIDDVKNLNSKPWEPIPFNSVPDKIPKGRAEFKLPCPISLLKKERLRKRKKSSDKKKILANFLANESESARKKMTMYSPTSHLFHPFKEEKIDDYQRIFDLHFKNRSNIDVHYSAVNTASGDLLGMSKDISATNIPDENDVDNCATFAADDRAESEDDDFPMPDTPDSSGSAEALKSPNSIQSYHNRIEKSVKEIYGNSDMRTDEEVAVAKWYEHLKPKLQEVARRPPFDLPTYKARVIQNLEATKNHKIDFNEMVQQQSFEPREVSRYFMASLQLANTYNVHIDTTHDVEGNNFKLSLLHKELSSDK